MIEVQRAVVSGGAGFIGSHLCDALLAHSYEVTALDNFSNGHRENLPSRATLIEGDIRDLNLVRRLVADCDVVFHLAAMASVVKCEQELYTSHAINLGGLISILQVLRDSAPHVPLIYTSSAAVYGEPEHLPLREDATTRPKTIYGLDKLNAEGYLAHAARAFGLRAVALRLFNVFGPRQDPRSSYSGVITIFANRVCDNRPLTIFGDGNQTRDFISVFDVVEALGLAASRLSGAPSGTFEVFNVCSGIGVSINRLFELLSVATGYEKVPQFAPPKSGDIRQSLGDPSRCRKAIGFSVSRDFEKELTAYLGWLRNVRCGSRPRKVGSRIIA